MKTVIWAVCYSGTVRTVGNWNQWLLNHYNTCTVIYVFSLVHFNVSMEGRKNNSILVAQGKKLHAVNWLTHRFIKNLSAHGNFYIKQPLLWILVKLIKEMRHDKMVAYWFCLMQIFVSNPRKGAISLSQTENLAGLIKMCSKIGKTVFIECAHDQKYTSDELLQTCFA